MWKRLNVLRGHSSCCMSLRSVESVCSRYPEVKRGNYSFLSENHVKTFQSFLGVDRVVTDPHELETSNIDWMKMVRGSSQCLLKPKTTEEVSQILTYCNSEQLAVCVQGGNTGVVGGGVPIFDEVVLSMKLMNRILEFDSLTGVLQCQSGCILDTADKYVQEKGFCMPLDLGSRGSCQIGGNLSTNAGGIRYVRYGSLHNSVLGLEAVLADGTVVDCLSCLKKDNTGFDLKHLFIGSEGQLGVVTKAAIECPSKPSSLHVAFLGLTCYEHVLKTYSVANNNLCEIISACELLDHESIVCVQDNLGLRQPLQNDYPFYMLLEMSGTDESHDLEKTERFLESVINDGVVEDGVIAQQSSQIAKIWQLRDEQAVALVKDGYFYCYDLSLPIQNYYDVVLEMRERLQGKVIRCTGFGHLGDFNLHLNITTKEYDPEVLALMEPWVYQWTEKVSGSISAEHGLGFKKKQFIHHSKKPEAVELMKRLKGTMDPNKILNPYKVLP